MSIENARSPLGDFLRPMLNLPAWNAQQGHGSFLTFEFGQPRLVVREWQSSKGDLRRHAYAQGQWHLWIYCCHWRITQDRQQSAHSEDTRETIGRAVVQLAGQLLTAVNVTPQDGKSTFHFDLGGRIETWPYGDDSSDEQWMILSATDAFSFRADGHYALGPSNRSFDTKQWLPLR